MGNPVIVYNASTGSDTAASGAGPATAVTGSAAAHTNGVSSTTVTFTNSPDLSGVAADDILWLNTASGARHLSKITAVDDGADTVTVEDSFTIGSGSAVDYAIGGKRQTWEADGGNPDLEDAKDGWIFELEDGTYNVSQAIAISQGDDAAGPVVIRGAIGHGPLVRASGTTDLFDVTGATVWYNVDVKGSAWRHGIDVKGENSKFFRCRFRCAGSQNFPVKGSSTNASMMFDDCYFIDEGGGAANSGLFGSSVARCDVVMRRCYFEGGRYAIDMGGGTADKNAIVIDRCVFNGQVTAAINVDGSRVDLVSITNSSFFNSTAQAIILNGAGSAPQFVIVTGNIFVDVGTYAVDYTLGSAIADGMVEADWNAFYNSGTADYNGINAGSNDITLTADPFTNSAAADFTLNATAGAGAACRAVLPDGPTLAGGATSYGDLGAYQHQDAGGGSAGTPSFAFISG